MARLERRLDALEAHRGTFKSPAEMTDVELMGLCLADHFGRRPLDGEVAEWLALPDDELRRRFGAQGLCP